LAPAARVYALVLRLYPRAHRQAFGEPMLQAFRDHYRDAVEWEGQQASRFWLGVLGDAGKSLVRERIAALAEGRTRMKKALAIGLLIAIVVALSWLLALGHLSARARLLSWIPLLALFAVLLALLARFIHTVPASDRGRSGARLGLVAGGGIGLYWAGICALYALYPVPPHVARDFRYNAEPVLLLSLPLLAGAVVVIGSYSGGALRTGVLAGLLAVAVGFVLFSASEVLLIALLWHAVQHSQLHSHLEMDYQTWAQYAGQANTFSRFALDTDYGVEPFVALFLGLVLVLCGGLFATLGGTLSVATRRTSDTQR
jgi:hypothetical protein